MSILTILLLFIIIIILSPYRERAQNSFSIQESEEPFGISHIKFCYFERLAEDESF